MEGKPDWLPGFPVQIYCNRERETVNANPILLQKKYARIVECFSVKAGISLAKALDFFYHSETYPLISQGVSDLHCMSDEYLADELLQEYQERDSFSGSQRM